MQNELQQPFRFFLIRSLSLGRGLFSVLNVVAIFAEAHEIAPLHPEPRILFDGDNMVDVIGWPC